MAVTGECGLRAGLAVTPTGQLLGGAEETRHVNTRVVIAVDGQGIHIHLGAHEHSTPMMRGIDHEEPTQGARQLHMGDHLVREHQVGLVGLQRGQARAVVPVPLASVRLGAP
jgi:hypothetical protein